MAQTTNDEELREQLQRDGYCVISNLKNSDVMRSLRMSMEVELFGGIGRDNREGAWRNIFQKVNRAGTTDERDCRRKMKQCGRFTHAHLLHLLGEVTRIVQLDEDLDIVHPNFLARMDGCQQQSFHRDTRADRTYFLIVALCDNYENDVIPGSHVITPENGNSFDIFRGDRQNLQTIRMNEGEVMVAHAWLVHRGGGSPEMDEAVKTSHAIRGGLVTNSGRVMNRLALHAFLSPSGRNIERYSTKKVEDQ